MRILILGAAGMLGHQMLRTFQSSSHEVFATIRKPKSDYLEWDFLQTPQVLDKINILSEGQPQKLLEQVKPNWVINCIGLTLRKEFADDMRANIRLNALLPHELEFWCRRHDTKLINYSTDCVFSGKSGNYTEESFKDSKDIYGQTKALGEIANSPAALTIRSSIIGREIEGKTELLEWFLSQTGKKTKGFRRAMYTGVTTKYMTTLTQRIIEQRPDLTGILQVASEPISKFDLLNLIKSKFDLGIEVEAEDAVVVNKTLVETKLIEVTGWKTPNWKELISEMARDADFYRIKTAVPHAAAVR